MSFNDLKSYKYYHIISYTNDDKCFSQLDMENIDEVINDYFLPYYKNEPFFIGGGKLNTSDINIFRCFASENKSEIEFNDLLKQGKIVLGASKEMYLESFLCDVTKEMLNEIKSKMDNNKSIEQTMNNKIFIVHGHDNALIQEVENFIRKIGLEPIVLHEQANKGLTIIEKIEEYSDVSFAVVLYTPCDEGKDKNASTLQSRARQNVVFEHGYFMAKLGRKNTIALYKDDVELPGDLSGVIYEKYQPDSSNWKINIVKELQACNFTVSADDI